MSGAAATRLEPLLLDMLGGAPPPGLSPAHWAALDKMVAQHRLEPMLSWQSKRGGGAWQIPGDIAERWHGEARTAALLALSLQSGLRDAAGALDHAGIAYLVLKGPRLAWRHYPEPHLRPMRDIDLLVAEYELLAARDALLTAHFTMEAGEKLVAEAIARDKHLPEMTHASSTKIELHHRLTVPPGGHGYAVPQLDSTGMLARAERLALGGASVLCPSANDLLAHLIVHALYGHRLDCGPLILPDIHFLLASSSIDAEAFRREANAGGWWRGAALLLSLTERYFGPQPLKPGEEVPDEVMQAAEQALLQDMDAREYSIAMADLLAVRSPRALATALSARLLPAAHVVAEEGGGAPLWRFWPGWALGRAGRLAGGLGNPGSRRQGLATARLMRWLQE